MKQLAHHMIDALKAQPMVLVLFAINLIFLGGIIAATQRKDALIADLIKACITK